MYRKELCLKKSALKSLIFLMYLCINILVVSSDEIIDSKGNEPIYVVSPTNGIEDAAADQPLGKEILETVEPLAVQTELNDTVSPLQNETQLAKNGTEVKIRCVLRTLLDGEIPTVHVVNSSALMKALVPVPNVTNGECAVVLFYSPYCAFSAKAAPHFNAIARIFPQISFYAIDAITFTSLNMRYGLVAVPTVLLFHNGKASVKYNDSEPTLDKMVAFLAKYTGIGPQGTASVLPEDSIGPISSVPQSRRDYVLILSWIFTLSFCCVWFGKSSLCRRMAECIRNTWQEAEAQHEHEE